MEIIFIDGGLVNKAGHSYTLAKTVSEALARRKLGYRIFGLIGLDTLIAAEIGAIPHFSRSLYDGEDFSWSEQRLRSVAAIFPGALAGGSIRSERRTWTALNETFERDLEALPADIWQKDNLVGVVAITQNQILGLVRFLRAMPRDRLPRVVCNLMFPPSYLPWGVVAAHGEEFYRAAFKLAAPLIGRSLFFTVENEAMRVLYRKDFGIRTRILPVPFGAFGPHRTNEDRVRVGFFGESRYEKGFHLLPRAIELCRRDGLDAEFIVQVNNSGWSQSTIDAEAALRALKGVRFLEGELSTEDYAAWTGRTDVMLLPYDPVTFGMRGSGIFTESVAAGRPVVASRGIFAGSRVENNQAEGEVFAPHTSEALAAAIVRLMRRLPACKARAAARAQAFAGGHSADAYVDVLLAHAKAREKKLEPASSHKLTTAAGLHNIANSNQSTLAVQADCTQFSLPLVSVIVVNYNYGRFLREAVDSVFEQTYPDIECIIVDNASTDESADVLQDIARQYPGAKIVRRKDNGGQSLASIEGFAASSGEYVVFFDADDYLLPCSVETHVFVHLSLRVPVGFSSGDVIQAVDSRMVLGTFAELNEFVRSGRGKSPGLLRRIDESAPGVWPLPSPGASIETQVHFVEPGYAGDWMWAPTSANCFRRDALQLFLNNKDLAALRSCTDGYLLRGINVVTGSVLIDRPLAVYRMHGMNVYSKHPHLNCVLNYDRGGPSDHNQLSCKMIMDHLIANVRLFLRKMPSPANYIDALTVVDGAWPPLPSTVPGCRSYLAGKLVTEAATLAPALGHREFIGLLKRLKVAPYVILKVRLWLYRNKEKRS